jgi:hypothetical protein
MGIRAFLALALGALLACAARAEVLVPEGFVLQILEPTGGRIARPQDWIYTEQHRPNVYVWTLSKEDPRNGPYDTGVRIHMFSGVEALTRQRPKEFVQEFARQKHANAKVLDECPPHNLGRFTRICVETEEPPAGAPGAKARRAHYALFWADDLDMAVFVTSSTTAEQWESLRQVFNVMNTFELLDVRRLEKAR